MYGMGAIDNELRSCTLTPHSHLPYRTP